MCKGGIGILNDFDFVRANDTSSPQEASSGDSSIEVRSRPLHGQKVRVGAPAPAVPPALVDAAASNAAAAAPNIAADAPNTSAAHADAVAHAEGADTGVLDAAVAPAVAHLPANERCGVLTALATAGALLGYVVKSVLDIVRVTAYILKYPICFFIPLYALLMLAGYAVDIATESLAPICAVFPGFSACRITAAADAVTATFGNLGRRTSTKYERIDFPALMAVQTRTLDQLLSHSAAGSQLALGVKHAELAVKDLGLIVRASNLTTKDLLARSLEEFSQQAKGAGRELQQLSAKLYGAVDTYVSLFFVPVWSCADSILQSSRFRRVCSPGHR